MIRYCSDPKSVEDEIRNLSNLRRASFDISELMRKCNHYDVLQHLGQAFTLLCHAQSSLKEHVEYYCGREEDGEWPDIHPEPVIKLDKKSVDCGSGKNEIVTHWNTTEDMLPDKCPNCGKIGNIGLGSADGRPGCGACLYELKPEDLKVTFNSGVPECPKCKLGDKTRQITTNSWYKYRCDRCRSNFGPKKVPGEI
jgi:hypothetical protein